MKPMWRMTENEHTDHYPWHYAHAYLYAGTVEATGLILKSPNGTRYKVTVNDDGTLATAKV